MTREAKTRKGRGTLMIGLTLAAVLTLLSLVSPGYAGEDEQAVTQVLTKMFDQPDNPLKFGPVVVAGNNAIADWYQGDKGGRALLWKKDGQWALRLCSGDSLKDAKMLSSNGIPEADAITLTQALAAAEATVDPAIQAKFSLFQGTMVMDKAL
jgi:hypothetical protein